MSRFSHGQPLQRTIKAVAFYQSSTGSPVPTPTPGGGTTPTNPPTTTPSTPPSTPLPTPVVTDLVVQVIATATAGIKLHNQASADSLASYAEMPGVPLKVIEDKTGALAKIGQNNQWIYVQDPNGHQGFVAGWFVEKSGATVPTTTPQPAPTPPGSPTPSTPAPTPGTPPPASGPQRMMVVVLNSVGAGGLRVRQQPSPGGAVVNIEKAGAKLTVIEPADTATPKIGVVGQWVAVKATNNQRGYIMAQYIQLKQ
jgi:hypothetical protein